MLFTIIPMAIDRQSGPTASFGAAGSRMIRHRIARSGKMVVATSAASTRSGTFDPEMTSQISRGDSPRIVHTSRAALSPMPSALFQFNRMCVGLLGGREFEQVEQLGEGRVRGAT